MTVRDQTMPDGAWRFDEAVTEAFDDMLERSIPAYNAMRELTTVLARRYARPDSTIVDLGCSRGAAIARIIEGENAQIGGWSPPADLRFLGVDVSEPMIAAADRRFRDDDRVTIRACDLRHDYPFPASYTGVSVTLSVLTLQFVPIEYRQQILRRAFASTLPGGALILVEKVLGATADVDDAFVEEYLAHKARQGYTPEQIARKRESLEGVLVPLTAEWNADLLRRAGFDQVDCFWRWLNFAGWVAVRGR